MCVSIVMAQSYLDQMQLSGSSVARWTRCHPYEKFCIAYVSLRAENIMQLLAQISITFIVG